MADVPDRVNVPGAPEESGGVERSSGAEMGSSYELVALLATAWSILIDELQKELVDVGYSDIRPAHGFAFQLMVPGGATGSELAEHLGVTKQAASQMIDFLEEREYVTRLPHPTDKRGKLVVLTRKGWNCIQAVEAIFSDVQQRWIGILGPERVAALQADLRRLVGSAESNIVPYRLRPAW